MNPFMRHNENGSVFLALVTPWGAGMPNSLRIMSNIFEKQRWKIFTQGPQEHTSEIQFSALNAFCSQKSSNYKILLWQLASFPFQIANSHLVLCYYEANGLAFRGQWQTWAELCIKDDFLFVTDVFISFFFGNFLSVSAIHWVFFNHHSCCFTRAVACKVPCHHGPLGSWLVLTACEPRTRTKYWQHSNNRKSHWAVLCMQRMNNNK